MASSYVNNHDLPSGSAVTPRRTQGEPRHYYTPYSPYGRIRPVQQTNPPQSQPHVPQPTIDQSQLPTHKRIHIHLKWLVHALKCQERQPTTTSTYIEICRLPICQTMKGVLDHLPACDQGTTCQVPYCATSRRIITHYKSCVKMDCIVCEPFQLQRGSDTELKNAVKNLGTTGGQANTIISPEKERGSNETRINRRSTSLHENTRTIEPQNTHSAAAAAIETKTPTSMDVRTAVMSEIAEVMDNELQCSICNELYVKTISLNCSHSFCSMCIKKWIQVSSMNSNHVSCRACRANVTCPQCRTRIKAKVRSIALDSYIERMTEKFSDEVKNARKELVEARTKEEAEFDNVNDRFEDDSDMYDDDEYHDHSDDDGDVEDEEVNYDDEEDVDDDGDLEQFNLSFEVTSYEES